YSALSFSCSNRALHHFPTRRSSDLLHDAADVVHDERRERLALDVFGDDQERTARLRDRLEQRQKVADVRDLLVVDQDVRVLELRSEEHTSELQSRENLVCSLLLETK